MHSERGLALKPFDFSGGFGYSCLEQSPSGEGLKMIKRIIASTMLLAVVLLVGCAEISGLTQDLTRSTSSQSPKVVRSATIESDWAMKQLEITVGTDKEVEILLRLANGDKVDGYFYMESGSIKDFQIIGNSSIYSAQEKGVAEAGEISSARFSFTAQQSQGTTYTLKFINTADDGTQKKETVFLEIIYPVSGSLFIPVETE